MIVKTYLLCKWAQHPTQPSGLFTPFIFLNQAELNWDVGGPQPDTAIIEYSADNTNFAIYGAYPVGVTPWVGNTADLFDNGYYRVIGKTGVVAVTNYSNVVSIGV